MSRPLQVEVSDLAKAQILAAEEWWRVNRAKAPNAIREDLERASSLIAADGPPRRGAPVAQWDNPKAIIELLGRGRRFMAAPSFARR